MGRKQIWLLGAVACLGLIGVFLLDGCQATKTGPGVVIAPPAVPPGMAFWGGHWYLVYDKDGDGKIDFAVDVLTGETYIITQGPAMPPPTTQPAQPASLGAPGAPAAAPPLEPPIDMQITGSASANLTARGLAGDPGSTVENTDAIDIVSYKPGLVDVVLHWNTTWGLPTAGSYDLAYESAYCPGSTPSEPGYAKLRLQGSESEVMSFLAACGVRSANFACESGDELSFEVQGNAAQVTLNGYEVTNVPLH